MITIDKPKKEDKRLIYKILLQWTEENEADKYLKRVDSEIKGMTEFNRTTSVVNSTRGLLPIQSLRLVNYIKLKVK